MKNSWIKVGCAVPKTVVGNVPANVQAISKLCQANPDVGVLVFPELCLTGYTCGDLFFEEALLEEAQQGLLTLAKLSEKNPGQTVIVGLPLPFRNALYNVAAFVSEGKIVGLIPKTEIPNYGEFYERRWFCSGKDILSQQVRIGSNEIPFGRDFLFADASSGAVLGAEICEDLWVPDKPSTHQALAGANILVNLSASDENLLKKEYRKNLVMMQSANLYAAYLYCSAGMGESSTDLVFSGHCLLAENGSLLEESIYPLKPQVTTALIDLSKIAYNRIHQSTFGNRNPEGFFKTLTTSVKPLGGKEEVTVDELVRLLKKEAYPVNRTPFVPTDLKQRQQRCQDILAIQANGLATRVRNTGIKTLVIGVSGGLDSTLALLVSYEAQKLVPEIRLIGVTMPQAGNTSSLTYQNSLALMEALGITPKIIPIGDEVAAHLKAIGHSADYQGAGDTTYENAQARMRTYLLMDLANQERGLVVGTGDLSELALGWCTYNGDHMSMYGVNASVPKTLVRYLVSTYAEMMADKALSKVLRSIVDTPITPELTPTKKGQIAQKTEDTIGKYDLNDFFLFYHLRYGLSPLAILALAEVGYPEQTKESLKEALSRFYARFYSQAFKRSCLPDGPKVGSVSLSPRGDYRMPSDADVGMILELIKNA
jgi:NAD+ synthase (glutamine-hydrolysing)